MKEDFLINQSNFIYNFAYKDEISNTKQTHRESGSLFFKSHLI